MLARRNQPRQPRASLWGGNSTSACSQAQISSCGRQTGILKAKAGKGISVLSTSVFSTLKSFNVTRKRPAYQVAGVERDASSVPPPLPTPPPTPPQSPRASAGHRRKLSASAPLYARQWLGQGVPVLQEGEGVGLQEDGGLQVPSRCPSTASMAFYTPSSSRPVTPIIPASADVLVEARAGARDGQEEVRQGDAEEELCRQVVLGLEGRQGQEAMLQSALQVLQGEEARAARTQGEEELCRQLLLSLGGQADEAAMLHSARQVLGMEEAEVEDGGMPLVQDVSPVAEARVPDKGRDEEASRPEGAGEGLMQELQLWAQGQGDVGTLLRYAVQVLEEEKAMQERDAGEKKTKGRARFTWRRAATTTSSSQGRKEGRAPRQSPWAAFRALVTSILPPPPSSTPTPSTKRRWSRTCGCHLPLVSTSTSRRSSLAHSLPSPPTPGLSTRPVSPSTSPLPSEPCNTEGHSKPSSAVQGSHLVAVSLLSPLSPSARAFAALVAARTRRASSSSASWASSSSSASSASSSSSSIASVYMWLWGPRASCSASPVCVPPTLSPTSEEHHVVQAPLEEQHPEKEEVVGEQRMEEQEEQEEQLPQEVEEVVEPPPLLSMLAELKAKAAQRVQRAEEAVVRGGGANEALEGKGTGASVKGPRTVAPTAQAVTKAGKPLTKELECLQQRLLHRRKSLRVNDHEDDEEEEEEEDDDDSWLDE